MQERLHLCELCTHLPDGRIRCHACSFRCILRTGDVGRCGVRLCRTDSAGQAQLYLSVYGILSAIHSDPIEKKPLYHFLPGTSVFSMGTIGCNFRCSFCQNYTLSQVSFTLADEVASTGGDIEDLAERLASSGRSVTPAEVVRAAQHYGCKSVAFTYNEPAIWGEFAKAVSVEARKAGLAAIYVTNGYLTPEHLDYIAPYVSALNIDLKSWNQKFYTDLCQASVTKVRQCIINALLRGFHVEVTTLIIPDENDDEDQLNAMARWLCAISPDIVWHLSGFHPDYNMLDKEDTSPATLLRAREAGVRAGLRYVYLGNIRAPKFNTTVCPVCGADICGHSPPTGDLSGRCSQCGASIAGVWREPAPVPGEEHFSVDLQASGASREELLRDRDARRERLQKMLADEEHGVNKA